MPGSLNPPAEKEYGTLLHYEVMPVIHLLFLACQEISSLSVGNRSCPYHLFLGCEPRHPSDNPAHPPLYNIPRLSLGYRIVQFDPCGIKSFAQLTRAALLKLIKSHIFIQKLIKN